MSTKITLLSPSPNQMSAIGNNAIDGSGLNIDVRISKKSAPICVVLANAVNRPASTTPATYPLRSNVTVNETARNNWPEATEDNSAATVPEKVGKRSGFPSHLAYASHAIARTASTATFLATAGLNMDVTFFELAVEEDFVDSAGIGATAVDLGFDAPRLCAQKKNARTQANGFRDRVSHK